MTGEFVKICGNVTYKYISQKGTLFLKLYDKETIDVVFFNDVATDVSAYNISVDDYQCVSGTISIYKGKLEIIAKKI